MASSSPTVWTQTSWDGPRLVVLACLSGTPTPTPDCEWQVIDASAGGADLRGTSSSFPPTPDTCVADATREASAAITEGSQYTSSMPLLSWDTTGLPANRVITDATLRLQVTDV